MIMRGFCALSPARRSVMLRLAGTGFLLLFSCFAHAGEAIPDLVVEKIDEDVFLHRSYNEVDGFGLVSSNGLVVVDGRKAFIVDTPWTDRDTEALVDWIREGNYEPVGAISTHSHDDRAAGIAWLNEHSIPTYASALTNEFLRAGNKEPAAYSFEEEATLADGLIEAFYPGAGHTTDNIVVWLPRSEILFGGCFVRSLASTGLGYTGEADIAEWAGSAAKVLARYPDARLVIPGHGKSGDIALLTHTRELALSVSEQSVEPTDGALARERVIVLTDIEADPDDTQSLVRLLLYANSIDIRGIVATTSAWMKTRIAPESLRQVIRAYGEVQDNLVRHEAGFPTAEELLARVSEGLPLYGMLGVGEGRDSPGSELIVRELERDDPRPLWISVWGGVNTLAQALYRIDADRTDTAARALIDKLRVYTISDQDDSGVWIRRNFPGLFYIVSPGDDYGSATWSAINTVVTGWSNDTIGNAWLAEHIQQGHGPLGAAYPDVAWGMEGDTPAFLGLVSNGLNVPEHPEWGGWGGRYEVSQPGRPAKPGRSGVPQEPETRPIWTDTFDAYTPYVPSEFGRSVEKYARSFQGNKVTLWRWRDDFQNDFAARMDWCLASYDEANHPPVPILGHPETMTVTSGKGFGLDASQSTDPDGDNLSFLWFHYPEAGTYSGEISIGGAENAHRLWIEAPEVTEPRTAHFILKVTDKGTPPLTRYRRVIVKIVPR